MHGSKALLRATCVAVIFMAVGCLTVQSQPEPMARPTRPKVFTSPEELKQYLDLVKDYYTLNSKPRYGKRADPYQATNAPEHPINILRMMMAIEQHKQRSQLAKQLDREEPSKLQMIYPDEHLNRYYETME
ncbi:pro-neuropeptide Y-like [Phymastichus coffea]|uniref:pro-neuropeptide Y-like n=1 Tax=Phymastichus coffea TaxID=108790 RepID=UPI00273C2206|nr:pro-neuropeptide Y-like [Phymastichus coffea]